jgi:hypothetical protein
MLLYVLKSAKFEGPYYSNIRLFLSIILAVLTYFIASKMKTTIMFRVTIHTKDFCYKYSLRPISHSVTTTICKRYQERPIYPL